MFGAHLRTAIRVLASVSVLTALTAVVLAFLDGSVGIIVNHVALSGFALTFATAWVAPTIDELRAAEAAVESATTVVSSMERATGPVEELATP